MSSGCSFDIDGSIFIYYKEGFEKIFFKTENSNKLLGVFKKPFNSKESLEAYIALNNRFTTLIDDLIHKVLPDCKNHSQADFLLEEEKSINKKPFNKYNNDIINAVSRNSFTNSKVKYKIPTKSYTYFTSAFFSTKVLPNLNDRQRKSSGLFPIEKDSFYLSFWIDNVLDGPERFIYEFKPKNPFLYEYTFKPFEALCESKVSLCGACKKKVQNLSLNNRINCGLNNLNLECSFSVSNKNKPATKKNYLSNLNSDIYCSNAFFNILFSKDVDSFNTLKSFVLELVKNKSRRFKLNEFLLNGRDNAGSIDSMVESLFLLKPLFCLFAFLGNLSSNFTLEKTDLLGKRVCGLLGKYDSYLNVLKFFLEEEVKNSDIVNVESLYALNFLISKISGYEFEDRDVVEMVSRVFRDLSFIIKQNSGNTLFCVYFLDLELKY